MIKVSVLYPYQEGARFDMNYYCSHHMTMVQQKLGGVCKGISVEQGLSGGAPGTPPAFAALGHLLFESVEAFQAAFTPHASAIMADIKNYTSIQPVIQYSEVKM